MRCGPVAGFGLSLERKGVEVVVLTISPVLLEVWVQVTAAVVAVTPCYMQFTLLKDFERPIKEAALSDALAWL